MDGCHERNGTSVTYRAVHRRRVEERRALQVDKIGSEFSQVRREFARCPPRREIPNDLGAIRLVNPWAHPVGICEDTEVDALGPGEMASQA